MTITKIMSVILRGFPVTLTLLLVSFILASLLGVALGWLYLRKNGLLSGLARVYLGIVRGTPPLLMLLLSYYGLPALLKGVGINIDGWSKMTFGIIGLMVGWSAYLAEAFRSAYLAVDQGQLEAALAVGITPRRAFFRIIVPQAALIALPNIENLFIGLVKGTSLVYVLGLYDMYNEASNLSNQTNGIYQLQILIILALIYWAFVLLIEWGFRTIAHRYQKVLG